MNEVLSMGNQARPVSLWLLGALVGMVGSVAGCGSEEVPATQVTQVGPVIAAPVAVVESNAAESNKPETELGVRPSSPEVKPGSEQPGSAVPSPEIEQVSRASEYNAPFPNRLEMFTPPRRKNVAVRRNNEQRDSAIELKGFVSPPGRDALAVLAIDGIIQPVAVGEEKFGIKVVSIDQPEVTLQRGSSRWTESLE